MSTLQDLLAEDYSTVAESALLDSPWRGAEAYHYYMLTQQQLYSNQTEAALTTVSPCTNHHISVRMHVQWVEFQYTQISKLR